MHRCIALAAFCGVAGSTAFSLAEPTKVPLTLNPQTASFLSKQPTWRDEFSKRTLDTDTWTEYYPGKRRAGFDTIDQVSINAPVDPLTGQTQYSALKITTAPKNSDGLYPTAMIGTQDAKFFKYGHFETRVKLQEKAGNWSAFWLQSPWIFDSSKTNPDPVNKGTELDIFEYTRKNNGDPGKASHAIHYNGYGDEGLEHRWAISDPDHNSTTPIAIDHVDRSEDAWNTISMTWTPDYYAFYVNNKLSWLVKDGTKDLDVSFIEVKEDGRVGKGEFNSNFVYSNEHGLSAVPEFMILSMEVPDEDTRSFAGNPAHSTFPDSVEFDYVRYYGGDLGMDYSLQDVEDEYGDVPRHPIAGGSVPEPSGLTAALLGSAALIRRRRRPMAR